MMTIKEIGKKIIDNNYNWYSQRRQLKFRQWTLYSLWIDGERLAHFNVIKGENKGAFIDCLDYKYVEYDTVRSAKSGVIGEIKLAYYRQLVQEEFERSDMILKPEINCVIDLHETSMRIMEHLILEVFRENWDGRQRLIECAFLLEREAALMTPEKEEPTRSVLFRSAISLAIQCHKFESAKALAKRILSSNPHPEIAEEIKQLMMKIEEDKRDRYFRMNSGREDEA